MLQISPMEMRQSIPLILALVLTGCAKAKVDGSEACTVEAVGMETGAGNLNATLEVPENLLAGAEISNGGISIFHDGCDFPLNSFFSDETARYIIENAPQKTLRHHEGFFRVIEASLSIWKFSDRSGETRFFVTGVHEMRPIPKARTSHGAKYYVEPSSVR